MNTINNIYKYDKISIDNSFIYIDGKNKQNIKY